MNPKGRPTEAEMLRRLGPEGFLRRTMRLARKEARRGLQTLKSINLEKLSSDDLARVRKDMAEFETMFAVLDHRRHRKSTKADLIRALDRVSTDRSQLN